MNQKAKKVLKDLQDYHSQYGNILAMDYGYKYTGGKMTNRMAIRFHVAHKLPEGQLAPSACIQSAIKGIPTDVIEVQSARPPLNGLLQPGTKISRPNSAFGTLGAIVERENVRYLLSCWHVLALSSNTPRGGRILQPDPDIKIAEYEEHAMNLGLDAAIAKLTTTQHVISTQYISGATITRSRAVKKGDILVKVGAKTGKTRAKVDGLNFTYSMAFGAKRQLIDCFRLVPIPNDGFKEISDGGDSGALWYDPNTLEGVGLNIAGEDDQNTSDYALACPLSNILSGLNVTLV